MRLELLCASAVLLAALFCLPSTARAFVREQKIECCIDDLIAWAPRGTGLLLFVASPFVEELAMWPLRNLAGVWPAALYFGLLHGIGVSGPQAVLRVLGVTLGGLLIGAGWVEAGLFGACAVHYTWNCVPLAFHLFNVWLTRNCPEPEDDVEGEFTLEGRELGDLGAPLPPIEMDHTLRT